MKHFLKEHDVLLRLLSLGLAVVIWAVVMGIDNPERHYDYNEIPIVFEGESALAEKTGLSIIEGKNTTITVRAVGKSTDVTDVKKNQISIKVDVSALPEAGEYDLPLDAAISKVGVDVQSIKPSTVHLRIDKITTKQVPVRLGVTGTPAEGCLAGTPKSLTEQVTVEGPSADLEEVAYAYATISVDGKDSALQENCAITLCNEAGEPIDSPYVSSKTQSVRVKLAVYQRGTVPLTVTLKDGGTSTANRATVTIDPTEVQVYGDQNIISEMKEINLGEIDLSSAKTGTAIVKTIDLPEGVHLADGQPKTATVTVAIDGVDTRKVKVTDFVVTDTSDEKANYTVTTQTENVEIELRGNKSALDKIDVSNFSIGLTVDSASLGEGTHEVKGVVAATGLPSGVTLVDEDVQVTIAVKRKESATPTPPTTPPAGTDTPDATEPPADADTSAEPNASTDPQAPDAEQGDGT